MLHRSTRFDGHLLPSLSSLLGHSIANSAWSSRCRRPMPLERALNILDLSFLKLAEIALSPRQDGPGTRRRCCHVVREDHVMLLFGSDDLPFRLLYPSKRLARLNGGTVIFKDSQQSVR